MEYVIYYLIVGFIFSSFNVFISNPHRDCSKMSPFIKKIYKELYSETYNGREFFGLMIFWPIGVILIVMVIIEYWINKYIKFLNQMSIKVSIDSKSEKDIQSKAK